MSSHSSITGVHQVCVSFVEGDTWFMHVLIVSVGYIIIGYAFSKRVYIDIIQIMRGSLQQVYFLIYIDNT